MPLALGAALLVGAFNGVMIAYVGMPPFVVTLGMLSIARSLAMVLSNNRMVYEFGPDQAAAAGARRRVHQRRRCRSGDSVQVPNPVLFLIVMALVDRLRVPLDASGAGTSSPSAATRRRRTSPACRSAA